MPLVLVLLGVLWQVPAVVDGSKTVSQPGRPRVRVETALGAFVLELDADHAPKTVENFLKYVDGGYYTGGRFHRATRPDNYVAAPPDRPPMQIIQGGINPDRAGEAKAAIPPVP